MKHLNNIDILREAEVWEARDFRDQGVVGYLITEEGNIHRPIAICLRDPQSNDAFAYRAAWERWAIGPRAAWQRMEPEFLLELSQYGRLDSTEMMPTFIYSLQCRPVEVSDSKCPGAHDVAVVANCAALQPHPYCKFMEESFRYRMRGVKRALNRDTHSGAGVCLRRNQGGSDVSTI